MLLPVFLNLLDLIEENSMPCLITNGLEVCFEYFYVTVQWLERSFCFYRIKLQLQLYTAKSQHWLHKAGASPEHWQFMTNNLLMEV